MQKIVSCRCTQCLHDITFVVPEEKIRRGAFPIILQNQHGIPPHKLMILISHDYQVKPFRVEDAIAAPPQASVILGELFDKIGLSPEEQATYFQCLQEWSLTIPQISQIGQISPKKALNLAEKLAEKGFFKKLDNTNSFYQPMPPYAAILTQFEHLAEYVQTFQGEIPKELEQSFKALEQQAKELHDPRDFLEMLKAIFAGVSAMMSAILSQIFAKLKLGSSIVGQFWDRAKCTNPLNLGNKGAEIITPKPESAVKSAVKASFLTSSNHEKPCQYSNIISKLQELEGKLDDFKSGNEVADYIQQLRSQFQNEIGFVPTLSDVTNWVNQLRHGFTWDEQGKDVLRKRVKYWEDKLNEQLSKPAF